MDRKHKNMIKMDSFVKRVEKIQKIKLEIDEFTASNNIELHPRLKFLIPWLRYSYSIFSRQYDKQKAELGEVKWTTETFKTKATKLTVRVLGMSISKLLENC